MRYHTYMSLKRTTVYVEADDLATIKEAAAREGLAEAEIILMAPTMQVAGTVVSRSDAYLSAEVEGRLQEVADVGTTANAGDVLAQIEDTTLRLRARELTAEVSRAEARLRFLDNELGRLNTLPPIPLEADEPRRAEIAADGSIVHDGRPLRRALLVSTEGSAVRLHGATLAASSPGFELWRPAGSPRLSLLAVGVYHDGWLSDAGSVTIWPRTGTRTRGTLRLVLTGVPDAEPFEIRFHGAGVDRLVTIRPGERRTLALQVDVQADPVDQLHGDGSGTSTSGNRIRTAYAIRRSFASGNFSARCLRNASNVLVVTDERRMLDRARYLIVSEIAHAAGIDPREADGMVEKTIATA